MTATLDASTILRRFVILRGLRWLPTGLVIPITVLLLTDRGLSLTQVGIVFAAQGVAVMLLELPTGSLADSLGRRPVLVVAGMFELTAMAVLIVADSVALLLLVFALQGVYRALESGPLDAWYVDSAQAVYPDTDIEHGLSRAGVATGIAIAVGAVTSSALVAIDPIPALEALVVPVLAAVLLRALEVIAILRLIVEDPPAAHVSGRTSIQAVPVVITDALHLVRSSRTLKALLTIELLWGAGMIAFEVYTPVRLDIVTGDPDTAAALLGPTNAVAWLLSAAGAGMAGGLTRRIGPARTGTMLLSLQALTVIGIALVAGPIGVIVTYVTTMGLHGAANPVHQGLLHRAVTDPTRRATVSSANSLAANLGGGIGGITLGALADHISLTTAILTGAGLLLLAAPLYLRARPQHPLRTDASTAHP